VGVADFHFMISGALLSDLFDLTQIFLLYKKGVVMLSLTALLRPSREETERKAAGKLSLVAFSIVHFIAF